MLQKVNITHVFSQNKKMRFLLLLERPSTELCKLYNLVFFQGWEEPSRYNPEPCDKTRHRGGRRQGSSSQVTESRDQTLDPGERLKRS